jgi:hypothetical protein
VLTGAAEWYDARVLRRVSLHLFTVLSALSLLLCVATCVLWVLSYSRVYLVERIEGNRREDCAISRGALRYGRTTLDPSSVVLFQWPPHGWTASRGVSASDFSALRSRPALEHSFWWGGFYVVHFANVGE